MAAYLEMAVEVAAGNPQPVLYVAKCLECDAIIGVAGPKASRLLQGRVQEHATKVHGVDGGSLAPDGSMGYSLMTRVNVTEQLHEFFATMLVDHADGKSVFVR